MTDWGRAASYPPSPFVLEACRRRTTSHFAELCGNETRNMVCADIPETRVRERPRKALPGCEGHIKELTTTIWRRPTIGVETFDEFVMNS